MHDDFITFVMVTRVLVMVSSGRKRKRKPKEGWHPQDIKAEIWKRGETLSGLARKNGLHESACRASLLRIQPEADKAISAFLGVPLHELWPSRYDEAGDRISHHVRDENKHVRAATHRLSAGQA